MTVDRDQMAARIFLRAVLPVMRVMLDEDPKTKARFADVTATGGLYGAGQR